MPVCPRLGRHHCFTEDSPGVSIQEPLPAPGSLFGESGFRRKRSMFHCIRDYCCPTTNSSRLFFAQAASVWPGSAGFSLP